MKRGDVMGAVMVWVLLGDGRAPRQGYTTAALVDGLAGYGVPRTTAYRWVAAWHDLQGYGDGRSWHPRQVTVDDLRTMVARAAQRSLASER